MTDSVAAHNAFTRSSIPEVGNARLHDVCGYIKRRWPAAAGLARLRTQILPVPGTANRLRLLGGLVRNTKTDAVALLQTVLSRLARGGSGKRGRDCLYRQYKTNDFIPDLSASAWHAGLDNINVFVQLNKSTGTCYESWYCAMRLTWHVGRFPTGDGRMLRRYLACG